MKMNRCTTRLCSYIVNDDLPCRKWRISNTFCHNIFDLKIKIEPEDSVLCICLPCLEKLNNVYNYKRLCLWNINSFIIYIQKLKSTDETYRNLQVTLADMNINELTYGNELNSDSIKTENSTIDNETINEDDTKYRQNPEVVEEIFAKESNEMRCIYFSNNIEDNENEDVIKEVVPKIPDDEINFEFVEESVVKEEIEHNYDIIDVKPELDNVEISNGTDNNEESAPKSIPECKISYECTECHQLFTSHDCLMKHRCCHTGEKPKHYKCNIGNKVFNLNGNLVAHIRSHTTEKPYKCDVCHKTFRHSTSVAVHKRSHTGEKPYACDTCNKSFKKKSILVKHIRCHTEEKPFKCDICNKAFSESYNLELHKRLHTGDKPHKCNVCDKAFGHRSNLVKHKLCHTGEKPYKCDECDKAFNRRYHLVTHLRCHTGDKPYKCDVCDKAFSHRASVVKHKRGHTGEKPLLASVS